MAAEAAPTAAAPAPASSVAGPPSAAEAHSDGQSSIGHDELRALLSVRRKAQLRCDWAAADAARADLARRGVQISARDHHGQCRRGSWHLPDGRSGNLTGPNFFAPAQKPGTLTHPSVSTDAHPDGAGNQSWWESDLKDTFPLDAPGHFCVRTALGACRCICCDVVLAGSQLEAHWSSEEHVKQASELRDWAHAGSYARKDQPLLSSRVAEWRRVEAQSERVLSHRRTAESDAVRQENARDLREHTLATELASFVLDQDEEYKEPVSGTAGPSEDAAVREGSQRHGRGFEPTARAAAAMPVAPPASSLLERLEVAPALYVAVSKKSRTCQGAYLSLDGGYGSWSFGHNVKRFPVKELVGRALLIAAKDLGATWERKVVPVYSSHFDLCAGAMPQSTATTIKQDAKRMHRQQSELFLYCIRFACVLDLRWLPPSDSTAAAACLSLSRADAEGFRVRSAQLWHSSLSADIQIRCLRSQQSEAEAGGQQRPGTRQHPATRH